MSGHRRLATSFALLLLHGCAPSGSTPTQSDRYAIQEAALAYMIRQFPPEDGYCLWITDREDSERLIAALSPTTRLCIGPVEQDDYGQLHDAKRLHAIRLSAEIKSLDDRRATVTTELNAGFEGGNWFTVTLKKENNRWIVSSATLDVTS